MAHETHALLSASSSHRWLNCPPSVRLSEGIPDQGSDYAREGTDAHSLCEGLLRLSDAGQWRNLTLHGREAVEQRYNWQRDGARLVAMYHKLLAE